ncbi:hypothetical protein J3459_015806 [Metarhizium acridum]|nr:hypothetical protein J3459_015806 [Metarhizium acridum]
MVDQQLQRLHIALFSRRNMRAAFFLTPSVFKHQTKHLQRWMFSNDSPSARLYIVVFPCLVGVQAILQE